MNLSKYDWKFTLFGVPVRVMITFWILCVFFSPFGTDFEGPWIFGLIGWALAVFLSFLTHELGHAFAMRKVYGGVPRIDLGVGHTSSGTFVFGGLTTSASGVQNSPEKRALTAGAGPVAEIAIALMFIAFLSLLGIQFEIHYFLGVIPIPAPMVESFLFLNSRALVYLVYFFVWGFVYAGLVWGAFNILPVFPYDGGQLLLAFLSKRFGARGVHMTLITSIVIAGMMGLLFLKSRNFFMAIFLFYSAYQNYRLMQYRRF